APSRRGLAFRRQGLCRRRIVRRSRVQRDAHRLQLGSGHAATSRQPRLMPKIHATAIVEDGARLGADVEIGPFSVIGQGVKLADGAKLHSHVVVSGYTEIGPRTVVYSHAVLGGGPQFRGDPGTDARLVIGADNVIREHVTMNGGSLKGGGLTQVGD